MELIRFIKSLKSNSKYSNILEIINNKIDTGTNTDSGGGQIAQVFILVFSLSTVKVGKFKVHEQRTVCMYMNFHLKQNERSDMWQGIHVKNFVYVIY